MTSLSLKANKPIVQVEDEPQAALHRIRDISYQQFAGSEIVARGRTAASVHRALL